MTIHKKFAASIVSFACALVMWQAAKNSCPPRERHLQAMNSVVQQVVDKIFEERINFPEESKELAAILSENIIPQAVEKLTSQRVDFSDYSIFSIGKITGEDGSVYPVSFGMFDRIFTVSEDDAYDHINKMIDDNDIDTIIQILNKYKDGKNEY